MSEQVLEVSNIINVTVTSVLAGLGVPNVNNVALFSKDKPDNVDAYRTYLSPDEIEKDYGTDSLTTKMAQNVFAQSPNLLSGGGRLIVLPLIDAVSATQGKLITADILASIEAFQAVGDGEFEIVLNGVTETVEGMDFTKVKTLADIAKVIQSKLPRVVISSDTTKITFKSKTSGEISTIVISASGGAGTDITVATLLNIIGATTADGVASSGETIPEAIVRTKGLTNYCGVISSLVVEDTKVPAIATAIQANDMIYLHPFADKKAMDGAIKDIKDASQAKNRCLLYTKDIEDAQLMVSAYTGRMFSVNFAGSNTTLTANLKALTNVLPDLQLNQTDYDKAKEVGADLYVSYAGLSRTLSSGGNTFFDRVCNQLQFKFDLQINGFNYLQSTLTKIPQVESGMDGLKDAYKAICKKFVTNGFIGLGLKWNSPNRFGDPQDFDLNIAQKGFYIYSQPIADQLQSDRDARKAPLCQIAIKEAGAVHTSIVNVYSEA